MLRRSPSFDLSLEGNSADYLSGCNQFRDLLIRLTQFSPDTAGWRVYRSFEDGHNRLGLDPTTQMDEAAAFYRTQELDGAAQHASMYMSAEVYREHFGDKKVSYKWNNPRGRDHLALKLDDMRHVAPVTFDRYLALADILMTWKRPRYMWVGDRQYLHKGHGMFDRVRTIANWFAWVPQSVAPALIPSAHLVKPHLGGTLIVTQPDFFNIEDNQPAIDRANAVEYEMNEAGVLPLLLDVN